MNPTYTRGIEHINEPSFLTKHQDVNICPTKNTIPSKQPFRCQDSFSLPQVGYVTSWMIYNIIHIWYYEL